jgi:hypothetical protein
MSAQTETLWAANYFKVRRVRLYRSRTSCVLRATLTLTSKAGEPRPEALERFYRAVEGAGSRQRGTARLKVIERTRNAEAPALVRVGAASSTESGGRV